MKETLIYLLQQLVDHPEEIKVTENKEEQRVIFTVHAHPEDFGKIIGRNGRIIKALRDLVRVLATKHQTYAEIVLAEEQ